MKVGFIIPAYNESAYIGRCIDSIKESCQHLSMEYNIIVVDNNSTDATPAIAVSRNCKYVIKSSGTSISYIRNIGAAWSNDDLLVFVDADTVMNERLLHEMLIEVKFHNVQAGGAILKLDSRKPIAKIIEWMWGKVCKKNKWFTGSFIFCTKHLFDYVRGFDETLFLAEDLDFSNRVNAQANTRMLKSNYITSARKLQTYSLPEHLRFLLNLAFNFKDVIHSRGACFIHYDARR